MIIKYGMCPHSAAVREKSMSVLWHNKILTKQTKKHTRKTDWGGGGGGDQYLSFRYLAWTSMATEAVLEVREV